MYPKRAITSKIVLVMIGTVLELFLKISVLLRMVKAPKSFRSEENIAEWLRTAQSDLFSFLHKKNENYLK